MTIVNDLIHKQRQQRVAIHCVGDVIIDEYYTVNANRVSPESPSMILRSNRDGPVKFPGGAANVAFQLQNFNVAVTLTGYSQSREPDFGNNVIPSKNLVNVLPFHGFIPRKRRFMDGDRQVMRWDVEEPHNGVRHWAEGTEGLAQDKLRALPASDVVILSDYDKGLFQNPQEWIKIAKDLSSIIIVDPKQGPVNKWRGCTVFKPNAQEAKLLSGLTDWRDQCLFFKQELDCESVVITRGHDGVVGFEGSGFFEHNPYDLMRSPNTASSNTTVKNVIGAGDCFASMLGLALAHGYSACAASKFAYDAGVAYVKKPIGSRLYPVDLYDDKRVNIHDLEKRDFRLVFTNGCFDILHAGHVHLLNEAKKHGDRLVVCVNDDISVRSLKGDTRPVNSLHDRLSVLASLCSVDYVCVMNGDTPRNDILACKPDVLVKGGDYALQDIIGADIVDDVRIVELKRLHSTSEIIRKL